MEFTFTALTKVYEKANSVVSYDVHCPTWLHKYIIGKRGAKIQEITSALTKVKNYSLRKWCKTGVMITCVSFDGNK